MNEKIVEALEKNSISITVSIFSLRILERAEKELVRNEKKVLSRMVMIFSGGMI